MKYILIWWVWASGTSTGSVEFNTEQACRAAAEQMNVQVGVATPGIKAICVAKGQPQ